ncbi:hypothetical protein QFC22_003988 [Naganishia vaughanmartiniae]|uniref:Uncharacterized protein n=1 Tax=Naganishia vaughanmartiniae TaxID=1424756 RepID=A0ACC2X662_9TREE|nr:hypothetical protein QFC22_003988 [Naganishia vaughanmartiniae]
MASLNPILASIEVMYFERDQLRSWSPVASSHVEVFPLLRFMILRQLEYKHDDHSRKQHQYSARVTISTFLQPSVSFFVSLFGIKSYASILDMPLKVQQDYQSRNQPVVSGIQYMEDLEPIHFAPKAFLTRSGRMSEDLELNNEHQFNGTHFGIGFQPPVTAANTRQIEETLEEIIILLPSDRQRMSLHLKFYDPSLNQCVYQAVRILIQPRIMSSGFAS